MLPLAFAMFTQAPRGRLPGVYFQEVDKPQKIQ